MASRVFGNRPDCAYYLMLVLCGAAVFTAFGGIFTYMGYWPDVAFHHPHEAHNYLSHAPSPNYYAYKVSDTSTTVYSVVGPLCLVIGVALALTIGVLAVKYDCEYEPEEPKVAIMRLASEMSLNISNEGKYEVIRTPAPGPSQEGAREDPSHDPRGHAFVA